MAEYFIQIDGGMVSGREPFRNKRAAIASADRLAAALVTARMVCGVTVVDDFDGEQVYTLETVAPHAANGRRGKVVRRG